MLPCPDPLKNALMHYCEIVQSFWGLRFARCPEHTILIRCFLFLHCTLTLPSGAMLLVPPLTSRLHTRNAASHRLHRKPPAGVTKKSTLLCETQRERTGSSWQQPDPQNRADGQDGSGFDSPSKPCHVQVSLHFVLFNLLACPTP